MGVIAFDSVIAATSVHNSPTSPITDSFTNTAGNLVLVGIMNKGGDTITGVTYNGVALTQYVKKQITGAAGTFIFIYGLYSPATGANNISISFSGSPSRISVAAVSYSSVDSVQPDNTASSTGTAATVTDTITTLTDKAWAVMFNYQESGDQTAGTGATLRGSGTANDPCFFDSNGAITPAGNYSMTVNWTGSSTFVDAMVSIKPLPVASSGMLNFFLN